MSNKLTRRRFFSQVAAATAVAGAVSVLPATTVAVASERKVLVAAHPWVYAATMANFDITPALDQIFADMKYAGMEAIELMHTALLPDNAVERIGELSHRHDLPVLGTSYGADMWDRQQHAKILEDAEVIITRLAQLNGRTFGTSVGAAPAKKTSAQLDAQADLLRKLTDLCTAHGVVLNLHNHTYEVSDGMYDLKGTLERLPDAKLGPDLDWLVQADVDPVKFLLEHGHRVVFLHLRDQLPDKSWVEAMGEGTMNYDAVRVALQTIRFAGDAVIELAHPRELKRQRPLRESLKMSRQFVKDKLGY
ncbi:MAG: sugar phosphate isomerase/epimerase family protein [Pirellulaceae bacterium]